MVHPAAQTLRAIILFGLPGTGKTTFARGAAQRAFGREYFDGDGHRATTKDFALRQTRPSLSPEIIDDFREDVRRFARY